MNHSKLDQIQTTFNPEKSPDTQSYFSETKEDYNRSPQEQKLLEEVENLKADRAMRKEYAEKAYDFAKYTIAFGAFLFFVYFLSPKEQKPLNDVALGIFTTACTVNILAAFISIIKGLFPSKK